MSKTEIWSNTILYLGVVLDCFISPGEEQAFM